MSDVVPIRPDLRTIVETSRSRRRADAELRAEFARLLRDDGPIKVDAGTPLPTWPEGIWPEGEA